MTRLIAVSLVAVLAGCSGAVSNPGDGNPGDNWRISVNDKLQGAVIDRAFYWGQERMGTAREGSGDVVVFIDFDESRSESVFSRHANTGRHASTVGNGEVYQIASDGSFGKSGTPPSGQAERGDVQVNELPSVPTCEPHEYDDPSTEEVGDCIAPTITASMVYQEGTASVSEAGDHRKASAQYSFTWPSDMPELLGAFKMLITLSELPRSYGPPDPAWNSVGVGLCESIDGMFYTLPRAGVTLTSRCTSKDGPYADDGLFGRPNDEEIKTYMARAGTTTITCRSDSREWTCGIRE